MKKIMLMLVVFAVASMANAAVLFEDNFDGYTADWATSLDTQSADWSGAGAGFTKFASWAPGKAVFSNNYWGDNTLRSAFTDVGTDDYTVNVEAWKYSTSVVEAYAVARATDTQYIAAGVVTDGTDSYARIIDSSGAATFDYWFAGYDAANLPINIELTVDGANVSATFSHMGLDITLNTTTTILSGGGAGFGGKYAWDYPAGSFDNFSVESIPEPATMALLSLGGLVAIRRKK